MDNLLTTADLARILRKKRGSLFSQRYRNPALLPTPITIGRRLYWRSKTIDDWLNEKEVNTN